LPGRAASFSTDKPALLLVCHRIPGRSPPALAYPARARCIVEAEVRASAKSSIFFAEPLPQRVKRLAKKAFKVLEEEVLPEPLEVRLSVFSEARYELGLLLVAIYGLARSLEAFYKESFEPQERSGVVSSLLERIGFSEVESRALSWSLEFEKPALCSATEGLVPVEGDPVAASFRGKSVSIGRAAPCNAPDPLLDLAAKVSSHVVALALDAFSRCAASQGRLLSDIACVAKGINAVWHLIYGVVPPRGWAMLLPSLPGMLEVVEPVASSREESSGSKARRERDHVQAKAHGAQEEGP